MRASARRALLLVTALGTACVTRTRRLASSGTTAAVGTPEVVQEMARQALLLDAKGDRGLEDRTRALQPTAAVGPLGVRRSTLDRVADLVRSARADEPHHEVEDEP